MIFRHLFLAGSVVAVGLVVLIALKYPGAWWAMLVIGPVVALGLRDIVQDRLAILRNFPVIGHLRYLLESIAPEIQQYFIERHTDGTPISRNHRLTVYRRSNGQDPLHPFGTELDVYSPRYTGIAHSIYPVKPLSEPPRVKVGGPQCTQPYEAALLNISAMSFGAISKSAIRAMGRGAKAGGFYANTGEGSLSPYHLEAGNDVVWQIGTGYFGCRTEDGNFDPDAFQERAQRPEVKMVEIKISQGAKPGHGGVLPAAKNTEEIARIRLVQPHTEVLSPPGHTAFDGPEGLTRFVAELRERCGGKPVGFKLCIGRRKEFVDICVAMKTTGIQPDFITVDGAEGGTGAAPLEYTDEVGMPLMGALEFVDQTLQDHGLREQIRVISSGKIVTAAHLVRVLATGADLCNAARAFMLAVGCIQALRCHTNACPTGVATQREALARGLDVPSKAEGVTNFQKETVDAALHLMAACGVQHPSELDTSIFLHDSSWSDLRGPQAG